MRKVSLLAIFLIIAQIIVGENLYSEKILSAVTGEAISQQTDTEIGSSIDYRYVSNFEALDIAKSYYGNTTEVDYYISTVGCKLTSADQEACDTSTMPDEGYEWLSSDYNWLIIVDEEPNKSWNHACGYVYVQSEVKKNSPVMRYRFSGQKFPTNTRFDRVDAINRYGERANIKPSLTASPTDYNTAVASRTYALVLDCASGQEDNKEQYWNDCSFIYKVLNKKYNVPEDNIYVLMGGYDAATHRLDVRYNKADGNGFDSCSDLDGNGTSDIHASVGRNDLYNTIRTLAQKVTNQDQLLVFVTGNGGYDNDTESNYIQLWNGEKMMSMQFDDLLDGINARAINIVLGQSMAGGFAQALSGKGRVICAACDSTEAATSCSDIPFTEFLYRWTSAMNQADAEGNCINSDVDSNGRTTIEEAFVYASESLSTTPSIESNPLSIQEDLAFNNIPKSYDLYIKDDSNDTGKEPNTTDHFWNSPDVWFRNQDDGILHQENEPITIDGDEGFVYIYTKVRNRGKDNYNGKGMYLHYLYASTPFANASTFFRNDRDSGLDGGEISGVKTVPAIAAGDSIILKKTFFIDSDLVQQLTNRLGVLNLNMLFVLSDKKAIAEYDITEELKKTMAAVRNSNNVAQHNKSYYFPDRMDTTIVVRFSCDIDTKLEMLANNVSLKDAEVAIELSDGAFMEWTKNGRKSFNVTPCSSNPKKFYLNGNGSFLETKGTSKLDSIKITCSCVANANVQQPLKFGILRTNAKTGEIISGADFEVMFNKTYTEYTEVEPKISTDLTDGIYTLSETNIYGNANYEWSNAEGAHIASGKTIQIDASKASGKYQLKVDTEDGAVGCADVVLYNVPIIESASIDASENDLLVKLSRPATASTSIMVSGATTNVQNKYNLLIGEKSFKIPIVEYPKGVYIVSVIEADKILGSKTVVK